MPTRQKKLPVIQKGHPLRVMKTFFLHANKVRVYCSRDRQPAPSQRAPGFRSERELAQLAAHWRASHLVQIWNGLPGVRPVRRFTDRKTALRRIWKEVQKLKPVPSAGTRKNTKADQILALLQQPSGATLQSIMVATGWQAHSVRGFIS